ncbi:uncharacterized protein [Periplaneta americana]|uniref:uncharacterized protein isoform X2 n=1 Tax=Periplaneta americana TaxID=6978 RepID=UPI0037E82214
MSGGLLLRMVHQNGKMPSNELETSYINSIAPSSSNSSAIPEPTLVIDNPRPNVSMQNDRREGISSPKKVHVTQSRKIPFWLWYIIAKALGLKLSPNEKPICAIILYLLTFVSALGYIISSIWYCISGIAANKNHSAQLEATVTVLVTALWCALGIYANKLAYRLFGHRKFLTMLRLHSKTVFKLNAALVVLVLWTSFIVLHNLGTMSYWIGTPCFNRSINRVVCQVRYVCQVVFSVFALVWNVLVAVVVISVCRTHTISIRKFIIELEQDAIQSDPLNEATNDLANDYVAVDEDYYNDLTEDSDDGTDQRNLRARNKITSSNNTISTLDEGCTSANLPPGLSNISLSNAAPGNSQPTLLTNAYILHKHWSIMVKLRISSMALQRWMVSVMALTIVWAAVNLVKWLSRDPHLYDVLNFFIPLLLLPLLCSAYSEVNNEGLRVPKCIRSSEDRLQVIQYLEMFPLHLTVFNYPIQYSTYVTVVSGFLIALVSKMLMDDLVNLNMKNQKKT